MCARATRTVDHGFTLIELLVVIAIIGILAGLIAAGIGRMFERAKLADLDNIFHQIEVALTAYYADNGSYPPRYGYLDVSGIRRPDLLDPANPYAITRPYTTYLGMYGDVEMYDTFSISGDTDRDGEISRLEFYPLDTSHFQGLYDPDNPGTLEAAADALLAAQRRPIIYIPVNSRQAEIVAEDYFDAAAERGEPLDPRPNDEEDINGPLVDMQFPPPTYDAYVLVSVGPGAHTGGLLFDMEEPLVIPSQYHPNYRYHVLGLIAYFMLTRDGNGNDVLDFDFRARTRGGEARVQDAEGNYLNRMPNLDAPHLPGPIVFARP